MALRNRAVESCPGLRAAVILSLVSTTIWSIGANRTPVKRQNVILHEPECKVQVQQSFVCGDPSSKSSHTTLCCVGPVDHAVLYGFLHVRCVLSLKCYWLMLAKANRS